MSLILMSALVGACSGERQPGSPWPDVPNVADRTVDEADDMLRSLGWRRASGSERPRASYDFFAGEGDGSPVRTDRWPAVCGARLTGGYFLRVLVARTRADCEPFESVRVIRLVLRDRRGREVGPAILYGVWIETEAPGVGALLIHPGTCDRLAPRRSVHMAHASDVAGSTRALVDTGPRRLCATHPGGPVLRASVDWAEDVAHATRARTAFVARLRGGRVTADAHGSGTRIQIEYAAIDGSSPVPAHLRPGSCRRLLPRIETPLTNLEPDSDQSRARSSTTVPIELSDLVRDRHVVEIHGGYDQDTVAACAQFGS